MTQKQIIIVKVILDTIQRVGLEIKNARGQCYDGASTMAGVKNGVATKIKLMNEAALYTHCYGHALNLAVNDCIRNTKDLNDVWFMLKKTCNLVKKSPSRESNIGEIHGRKQKIIAKGSEYSARPVGQFTVRHVPQYSTIMKN